MKDRSVAVLLILLCILPLSGCWDKVEIEQRAIISAMIIEKGDRAQQTANPSAADDKGRLKVTFRILVPQAQGQGKDIGYSRVIQAKDMSDALNVLGEETSRVPFYGQTRMLVLSKDFLKDKSALKDLLDFVERDPEMNTQMRVLISQNGLEVISQIQPKLESSITEHIRGILDNAVLQSATVSVSLENLIDNLRESDGLAVAPILEAVPDNQTFRVDELGLIKDYTYLTELDSERVKDFKIITNTFDSGRQEADFNGEAMSVYINSCKTKKELKKDKQSLGFKVTVEMEGDLKSYSFEKSVMDKKLIEEIEAVLEKQIEEELSNTTEYFQQNIGYDYLGFQDYLKKYEPKEYKEYEGAWDQAFQNADIEYQVIFHVRRIGTSK